MFLKKNSQEKRLHFHFEETSWKNDTSRARLLENIIGNYMCVYKIMHIYILKFIEPLPFNQPKVL